MWAHTHTHCDSISWLVRLTCFTNGCQSIRCRGRRWRARQVVVVGIIIIVVIMTIVVVIVVIVVVEVMSVWRWHKVGVEIV